METAEDHGYQEPWYAEFVSIICQYVNFSKHSGAGSTVCGITVWTPAFEDWRIPTPTLALCSPFVDMKMVRSPFRPISWQLEHAVLLACVIVHLNEDKSMQIGVL